MAFLLKETLPTDHESEYWEIVGIYWVKTHDSRSGSILYQGKIIFNLWKDEKSRGDNRKYQEVTMDIDPSVIDIRDAVYDYLSKNGKFKGAPQV